MNNSNLPHRLILTMLLLLSAGCAGSGSVSQAQIQGPPQGSITYQTFYDELSPYGTWIDYPSYGHVWNPRVEGDFRPYATNGYWNYSDEGWAWMSGYNWGWAPFHYGRWLYDNNYGWLWLPGYDWSPAWVTWGFVDDDYCWAPLMPEVNVGMQFGGWRPHDFYWNVCPRDHIYDRNLGGVLQRPGTVNNISSRVTIINNFNTTNVHNQYYAKGPNVKDVEQYTHHTVTPVAIKPVNTIGDVKHEGNEMRVYRPQVQTPQPKEFRQVQSNTARPVRVNDEWPAAARPEEQRNNVEQLPRMNSPAPEMRGGAPGGGRGGDGRRH
jgi:hypothetical protein